MEEYQYTQPEQQETPKKQPQAGRGRFLRVWGPVLIKLAIVYLVSVIFTAILMGRYLGENVPLDTQSVAEYMAVEENYYAIQNEVLNDAVQYTTLVEGFAALITIPILAFMFYRDRVREKLAGYAETKRAPFWTYIGAILLGAALCLGINNLMYIGNLASVSSSYEATMEALYTPSLGIQIICLGILIPVCEELVFRGLMFKRLREYGSFKIAMIYSAIVFSFMHFNIVQTIYAFFMAVVFAFLYERYNSVKAPILAHVSANITAVLVTNYNAMEWLMADPMRVGIATVGCAAVASSMYVFVQRMDESM